jgi:hypothetical protein
VSFREDAKDSRKSPLIRAFWLDKPKRESIQTQPALARAKESAFREKSETIKESLKIKSKHLEAEQSAEDSDGNGSKFLVALIQEGLGNLNDGYYYTKEALQLAAASGVFEGKKMYADHPGLDEEETRPERSVRDIIGHFENVKYIESQDGTGMLQADLVMLPEEPFDWARSLVTHAVNFSQKYPDKDFVGLSINAGGDMESVSMEEFLSGENIVPSARGKLSQAQAEGVDIVKVVKVIDSAVSVDLVTEAGAKGKVLKLLEAQRMDKKEKKEAKKKEADVEEAACAGKKEAEAKEASVEEASKADGDKARDAAGEEHDKAAAVAEAGEEKAAADGDASDKSDGNDDEAQDKLLIMQMLKKHGLVDGSEDDAHEAHQKKMEAAKSMMGAYEALGHKKQEAAMRAAEAMKVVSEAQAAADSKVKEAAEAKESAEIIKLKGENAKLKEDIGRINIEKHLDKKLQESKLPMAITKKFREAVKAVKSTKEVDEKFDLFMEGYRSFSGEVDALDSFVTVTEKEPSQSEKGLLSLEDCVD